MLTFMVLQGCEIKVFNGPIKNTSLYLPGLHATVHMHRHCPLEIVHVVVDHLCELIDEAVLVHGRIEEFYIMGNVFHCAVDYL
jgi:hypothetical protein